MNLVAYPWPDKKIKTHLAPFRANHSSQNSGQGFKRMVPLSGAFFIQSFFSSPRLATKEDNLCIGKKELTSGFAPAPLTIHALG